MKTIRNTCVLLGAFVAFFFVNCAYANPIWKLQVTYPTREEKAFNLPDGQFKIPLKSSVWSCVISANQAINDKYGRLDVKIIICDKATDHIQVTASCSVSSHNNGVLTVYENFNRKSEKMHDIRLYCM